MLEDNAPPPPSPSPERGPRGLTVVAWIVIILIVLAHMYLPSVVADSEAGIEETNAVADVLTTVQGRYLVGAGEFTPRDVLFLEAEGQLNVGGVPQRLRFVVLAGELAGPAAAIETLDGLDDLIAKRQRDEPDWTPTPSEQATLAALRKLYTTDDPEAAAADPAVLDETTQTRLREELGWFGELALAPRGVVDEDTREDAMSPARTSFVLIIGAFGAAAVAGFLGFIGLIIALVFAATGRLRSGVLASSTHHGLYAETFALWMIVFLAAQVAVGLVVTSETLLMPALFGAFFFSLVCLAWPVVRGVPWRQVRRDIGWTAGRQPALEPVIGVAGYAMGLPIVAIGLLLTFILLLVQTQFGEVPDALDPAVTPAHPVITQLTEGMFWILLLGAVAAPVVEETMFRGVLYRHLRDASRPFGFVLSVFIATFVNAFVFAIIHPQGWVAAPALMSIAIAVSLVREWRGTVIPCVVIHGVSNAIVLGMVGILLGL